MADHFTYTKADIEKYLNGQLTAAEMHRLEKAALQDPFLADAIEGYASMSHTTDKHFFTAEDFVKPSTQINPFHLADIKAYLQQESTPTEQHLFEKESLHNHLLADAVEGYQQTNFALAEKYLAEIKEKITGNVLDAKVVSLPSKKKNEWLKIAAAIVLMVGAGSTIWWVNNKNTQPDVTIAQAKNEVLTNADKPSVVEQPTTNQRESLSKKESSSPIISQENNNIVDNKTNTPSAAAITTTEEQSDVAKALNGRASGVTVTEQPKQMPLTQAETALKTLQEDLRKKSAAADAKKEHSASGYYNNNTTANQTLRGRVLNSEGEAVIANIQVENNNKRYTTVTDAQGNFNIQLSDTIADVTVASVGYDLQRLQLNSNRSNQVTLNRSNQNLDEVVVIGYNTTKSKEVTAATVKQNITHPQAIEPIGGWNAFHQYLNSQNAIADSTVNHIDEADEETVLVQFKIDNTGKPYDIRATNSNDTLKNKAINLIKDGPKWTVPTKKSARKVKLAIKL